MIKIAVILLTAVELALAFSMLFLLFLALAGIFEKENIPDFPPRKSFAAVISAHNEELLIGRLLKNLHGLDYPKHLYDLYVIANNCTDNTAKIAREEGARCFERKDTIKRSKGHALAWAFQKILNSSNSYDAFVVFDADTLISKNFLKVMNYKLCSGGEVIQAYYGLSNPEDSWLTRIFHIGFTAQNKLMLPGLSHLGKVCRLRGNGMCFSKQIIQNIGWKAFSMMEDMELYLQLLLANIKIEFSSLAKVSAEMPLTLSHAAKQRMKWYRGHSEVTKKYTPQLLLQGFQKKNPAHILGAINTIVPPIASLSTFSVLIFIMHLFLYQANILSWIAFPAAIIALEVIYVLIAMLLARSSLKSYVAMIFSPVFLIWRLTIELLSLVLIGSNYHIRTDRSKPHRKST